MDVWGSKRDNRSGINLYRQLNKHNLTVTNDGTPTHYKVNSGFNVLDLTIVSNSIALQCNWETYDDFLGNDHIPINISFKGEINSDKHRRPTISTKKVERKEFNIQMEEISNKLLQSPLNHQEKYKMLTEQIIETIIKNGGKTLSETYQANKYNSYIWWNSECDKLVEQRKEAFRSYRKNQSHDSFVQLQQLNTETSEKLRKIKNKAFQDFTNSINPNKSIKEVWDTLKKFDGTHKTKYTQNKRE